MIDNITWLQLKEFGVRIEKQFTEWASQFINELQVHNDQIYELKIIFKKQNRLLGINETRFYSNLGNDMQSFMRNNDTKSHQAFF